MASRNENGAPEGAVLRVEGVLGHKAQPPGFVHVIQDFFEGELRCRVCYVGDLGGRPRRACF